MKEYTKPEVKVIKMESTDLLTNSTELFIDEIDNTETIFEGD